jgi:AraC-like DNA-binding protein
VLVPNVWHRYKPDESMGWHEHWVGFSGSTVRQIFRVGFFSLRDPVIPVREEKDMLDSFHQIFQCAKERTPGLQQLMAARTAVLLSLIRSSTQPLPAKTHSESDLVELARSLMLSQETRELALEDIARRLNVSYSTFRRTFREHTGVSPHQYRPARQGKFRTRDAPPYESSRQRDQCSLRVRRRAILLQNLQTTDRQYPRRVSTLLQIKTALIVVISSNPGESDGTFA